MKNYKNLIASSLAIAIVLSSPAVSFAKDNEKNNGREKEDKQEKVEKSNWFSSGWFGNRSSKNATKAPVISNVTATSIKGNKATIKWNTDVKTNSFLWYSTTSTVDTSVAPLMKRGDRVLKHKFELKKLQPNTLYYVIVGSANNVGTTKSDVVSFTTGSYTNNESIPVITSVTGPATIKTGEVATFEIKANDPQSKALTYSVNWGDNSNTPQTTLGGGVATITHTYSTVGTYVAKFMVINSDGKKATYPMQVKVISSVNDTTAPVVGAFVIPATASTLTVNITTFTATDANGVVGYKITESATAPLASDAGWTTGAPTSYTFGTAGAKTLYAWAKDGSGNVSTSLHDSVIITLADTTAPTLTNITTSVTGTSATVSWTTNEAANSTVFYSTGSVDLNNTATPKVTDSSMVTNHSISIPGLTSATLYHFIIKSADASNNSAVSSDGTFTTN